MTRTFTITISLENTAHARSRILILKIRIQMKWFSVSFVKTGSTTRYNIQRFTCFETKKTGKRIVLSYISIWERLRQQMKTIQR